MEETSKSEELLKKPYNPIDPIVVFDPELEDKYIIKSFDNLQNKNNSPSSVADPIKDDAINIPVIKLNNITLNDDNIDFVEIKYEGFLPTIHLSIKDSQDIIRVCDTPGYDNEIRIAITTEVNGYYKKIKLQFYIIDFKIFDEYISYHGIYKLDSLNTSMFKQIGDKELTTYEMLEEIAKDTKLGFAASDDCKNIKDKKYRLIQSSNYIDYIKSQIAIAGTDEDSILDCWIDLFGYIVLMNVSRAMKEDIDPKQLMVYSMFGIHGVNGDIAEVKPSEFARTLTNHKISETSFNLFFNNYENIVNNSTIYSEGALNEYYYMSSPGKENKISHQDLQIIENSVDGNEFSKNYEYKKVNFIGIEFEDEDVIYKQNINKRFFDKLKTRKLKIELESYNLGLQRGTLVNVLFKEYNNAIVKTITDTDDVEGNAEGVLNPYSSGIYYIDSMDIIYNTDNHKIQQFLYLIKRDAVTNPINRSTEPLALSKYETE